MPLPLRFAFWTEINISNKNEKTYKLLNFHLNIQSAIHSEHIISSDTLMTQLYTTAKNSSLAQETEVCVLMDFYCMHKDKIVTESRLLYYDKIISLKANISNKYA